MATLCNKFFTLLLLLSSVLSIASSRKEPSSNKNNIDYWCNLTPHPEPCKHYTSQPNNFTIKHRTEFRGTLIQMAINQALIMQKEAHDFQQNTVEHKTVHGDCLKLYENTIFHLNRTLEGLNHENRKCSPVDAQTWLTTALTNIETCKTGAVELNAHQSFIVPTNNVTEMIRNSLAINMDFLKYFKAEESTEEEFPSWFSGNERRILKGSSIKANSVVAKDGSGNFKTVQDALNAAISPQKH